MVQGESLKYIVAASIAWIIIPILIINLATFFGADTTTTTPPTYEQLLSDLTTITPQTGLFSSIFKVTLTAILTPIDFLLGWAIEPVVNAAAEFFYSLDILVNEMGLPSWVVYLVLTIYSVPVMIGVAYLFIELVKAIGSITPFT